MHVDVDTGRSAAPPLRPDLLWGTQSADIALRPSKSTESKAHSSLSLSVGRALSSPIQPSTPVSLVFFGSPFPICLSLVFFRHRTCAFLSRLFSAPHCTVDGFLSLPRSPPRFHPFTLPPAHRRLPSSSLPFRFLLLSPDPFFLPYSSFPPSRRPLTSTSHFCSIHDPPSPLTSRDPPFAPSVSPLLTSPSLPPHLRDITKPFSVQRWPCVSRGFECADLDTPR